MKLIILLALVLLLFVLAYALCKPEPMLRVREDDKAKLKVTIR